MKPRSTSSASATGAEHASSPGRFGSGRPAIEFEDARQPAAGIGNAVAAQRAAEELARGLLARLKSRSPSSWSGCRQRQQTHVAPPEQSVSASHCSPTTGSIMPLPQSLGIGVGVGAGVKAMTPELLSFEPPQPAARTRQPETRSRPSKRHDFIATPLFCAFAAACDARAAGSHVAELKSRCQASGPVSRWAGSWPTPLAHPHTRTPRIPAYLYTRIIPAHWRTRLPAHPPALTSPAPSDAAARRGSGRAGCASRRGHLRRRRCRRWWRGRASS